MLQVNIELELHVLRSLLLEGQWRALCILIIGLNMMSAACSRMVGWLGVPGCQHHQAVLWLHPVLYSVASDMSTDMYTKETY